MLLIDIHRLTDEALMDRYEAIIDHRSREAAQLRKELGDRAGEARLDGRTLTRGAYGYTVDASGDLVRFHLRRRYAGKQTTQYLPARVCHVPDFSTIDDLVAL